jgi:uncharacterized protein
LFATFVAPRGAALALALVLAFAMLWAALRLLRRQRAPELVPLRRSAPRVSLAARLLALAPREPLWIGALSAVLPCGALYGALLIAVGMGSASAGALAMTAFGLASGVGLVVAPLLGRKVLISQNGRRVLAAALVLGALVVVLRPLLATEHTPPCCTTHAAHS